MGVKSMAALVHQAVPHATFRVLGWGIFSGLAVSFLWYHPTSPIALWRGDVALGSGRPHNAIVAYDAVGHGHPDPAVRAEALRRSALVWAVELGRPDEARLRYEWLLPLPMDRPRRAKVLDHLGELLVDEGRYRDAAQRLREAHDLDPGASEAGDRLVRSARAAAMAGDDPAAERTWRRLATKHPVLAARASLGRANLRLQRGDAVGALALYEGAVDTAFDPDVAAVAQLGITTCLERLGDLDSALSELHAADLPSDIQAQRASSIRARERLVH
ncbi:MAG TPA: tetratricopeptide repeat protein [Deltaproteobacteria bacterium]|nr:tetratricopeptide repeat protein [Deltaproteobacteria bacterium]